MTLLLYLISIIMCHSGYSILSHSDNKPLPYAGGSSEEHYSALNHPAKAKSAKASHARFAGPKLECYSSIGDSRVKYTPKKVNMP
jgi:hypothetical protein